MGAHIVFQTEQGNGVHGRDDLQPEIVNGKKYMYTATIRVPATPRIDPKDSKSREVGPGVRLAILVHEMIHAVGLDNSEHSKDDVFIKSFQLMPKGQYVNGVQLTEDVALLGNGSDPLPPVRIESGTITKLKQAWTGEDTK